ncbi:Phosphorylated carbohydrates phosphatase [Collinsella intestinalis]|uniref:Phosphorylated carbohydrates phosphatase n=1 Tax=Collinsella intestinalis TaxID=147207 RepID=A0A5K1IR67_9ACTN|nr:HAD family phosphatase [Collinsella intestinalis]VWL90758.1 Phosphorylated carbohydrates phosphatase [Collinsella intestinalis]
MAQTDFPFAAVIFDMDGVIVDTEKFYLDTLARLFEAEGIEVPFEDLCVTVGASYKDFKRNLVRWFELGGEHLAEEEALARYNVWEERNQPDFAALLNHGVVETIAELKRCGVRVALASSSPMSNILLVLEACGLSDAFELVTSGEQFHESKPNPEIYLHTLENLGLPAGDCCCVEDSVPGITAGKAAGLTVFAKREDRFGFTQEAADRIIDAIPDLLEAASEL